MTFRDPVQAGVSGVSRGFTESRRPAEHVWVLTGSIGAVTAATRLLGQAAPDRSLAFIVALRVSTDGIALITPLLEKCTPYRIYAAGLERTLYPSDLLVIPIDGSALPDSGSRSGILPRSIDEVLHAVAERYRDKAGVIVLSGIGYDGVHGCQTITRYGGQVWVQDSASCRHSSLPQAIRASCDVGYCASPEQLGARLMAGIPAGS